MEIVCRRLRTLEAPTESQIGSRCRPHTALLRRVGSSSTTISNCGRGLIGSVVTSDKSVSPEEPTFCITQGSAVALGKCCSSNLDVRIQGPRDLIKTKEGPLDETRTKLDQTNLRRESASSLSWLLMHLYNAPLEAVLHPEQPVT